MNKLIKRVFIFSFIFFCFMIGLQNVSATPKIRCNVPIITTNDLEKNSKWESNGQESSQWESNGQESSLSDQSYQVEHWGAVEIKDKNIIVKTSSPYKLSSKYLSDSIQLNIFNDGCPEDIVIFCSNSNEECKLYTKKGLLNYMMIEANHLVDQIQNVISSTNVKSTQDLQINTIEYKLTCEDVQMLHTVWMIMWIVAPSLVVVFGTVDYFKAVIAGDQEKMQKARKRFPKRVIALIVLILVPSIITIIVNFGTRNVSDSNLMYCVINGGE